MFAHDFVHSKHKELSTTNTSTVIIALYFQFYVNEWLSYLSKLCLCLDKIDHSYAVVGTNYAADQIHHYHGFQLQHFSTDYTGYVVFRINKN